jgi:hypothetical protein
MQKGRTVIGVDVPESGAEPLAVYSLGVLLVLGQSREDVLFFRRTVS